ncbi:MAG: alpha/beta fold hydrolase [Deltaproteobacteria bacterium]|nr:alpha/beta fold hydrolase [Deltaproteobacteria bacterium]
MLTRLKNLATLHRRAVPPVGATPHAVVHAENKWRLLRYHARPQGLAVAAPVLLVPSLINRHYVLDLTPGKSFAEFLVGQGFDVFCVDWGRPDAEDRHVTFDAIADRALGRALRRVCDLSGQPQAHVLGYCLGGTLTAIHAALHPERVASLCCVAAPIAFAEAGIMRTWLTAPGFDIDALVDGFGLMPAAFLQFSFQMLRPTLGLSKAVHLIDRAWNDKFLDGWLALETWANDNVAIPGEFYRTYVRDLYQRDLLRQGRLLAGGRRVDLGEIRCPLLVVTFTVDAIAPAACCAPLLDLAGSADKRRVEFDGSHVGGMTSSPAAKGLWPQMAGFWMGQESPRGPL